jgi:hypothetical protein
VNSHLTEDFVAHFRRLPRRIQELARKNYRLWKRDPAHPSLDFKQVSRRSPIFSVRVGIGWRAVGVKKDEAMIWFWIGSHAEYDKLLKQL